MRSAHKPATCGSTNKSAICGLTDKHAICELACDMRLLLNNGLMDFGLWTKSDLIIHAVYYAAHDLNRIAYRLCIIKHGNNNTASIRPIWKVTMTDMAIKTNHLKYFHKCLA